MQARKPPKLQHVLKNELKHGERQHDLVKKVPRIDGIMEAPEFDQSDYGEIRVWTIPKVFQSEIFNWIIFSVYKIASSLHSLGIWIFINF